MELGLDGRVALVTASSNGIGREIAASLAAEGAVVHVNGRTKAAVDAAMDHIATSVPRAKLRPLVADNGTAEGTAATIRAIERLDILVNNLGVYDDVPFFESTDAQWLRSFEINVLSGVRLSRHYLPRMLESRRGRIVFIASEAAISPAPELPYYSATKAMQLSVSRVLAELTKGTPVTVNAVLPGSTGTDGAKAFVQSQFPELGYGEAEKRFMKENRGSSLLQRLIAPREVADFVAFVASDRASAINGAALRADGGIVRSVF
jgi:3-oxoacyl-[acyl-carrier protein] reductase